MVELWSERARQTPDVRTSLTMIVLYVSYSLAISFRSYSASYALFHVGFFVPLYICSSNAPQNLLVLGLIIEG